MEDKQTKLFLGKILGEIYRIQQNTDGIACPASKGKIYGLLNGFEEAIDEELEMIGFVSNENVNNVADVLDEIWLDKDKLSNFKGFYDIERKLNAMGIDRGQANKILTYFYADGKFEEIIDKMDTSDSPVECKRFKLSEFDS